MQSHLEEETQIDVAPEQLEHYVNIIVQNYEAVPQTPQAGQQYYPTNFTFDVNDIGDVKDLRIVHEQEDQEKCFDIRVRVAGSLMTDLIYVILDALKARGFIFYPHQVEQITQGLQDRLDFSYHDTVNLESHLKTAIPDAVVDKIQVSIVFEGDEDEQHVHLCTNVLFKKVAPESADVADVLKDMHENRPRCFIQEQIIFTSIPLE